MTYVGSDFFWGFVLVRDDPLHCRFEVGVKGKPDSRPRGISLDDSLIVGQRVVVEEEATADIESYEDVDGVVFVGG